MNEIERLSASFIRHREALRKTPEGSDEAIEACLPPGVRAALDAAVAKVESLQEIVEAELRAVVPTRGDVRSTRPVEPPARAKSRLPRARS